ncbi:glycosyltransferase [Antarcticirhabdus aurantiaca]|uniref:Glycosyltransferase n=1 Tax=Antarcticirhabdus aurantiaca TaxID=2606717 RepID=A0ACD4NR52_9HYPH|nr:glycosyltransferase [Antarcticirhabdus aurantiaca]WAJ29177.1 glycosyltransferase [Jeongeuplla avenae]
MKVAIVHYWLVTMRGGEKVVEELCRLYPEAEIFTLVCDRSKLSPLLQSKTIHTSFLQKLPGATRNYTKMLPLMPFALEQFDLQSFDLVISSESGPAKGVITRPDALHVCYCHSPMRYIWDHFHIYKGDLGRVGKAMMNVFAPPLRVWDVTTAARVDAFAANSAHVGRRIRKFYNRDSTVIHPPVAVDDFDPTQPRDDFYLCAGQIVRYKRVDLAVEAFNRSGRRLVVIGDGAQAERLKRTAGPNVTFLGYQPFPVLRDHLQRCRALIFPGEEDFGILPVEAMAAGAPVIAYDSGGARETVVEAAGIRFPHQSVESLNEALDRFEAMPQGFDPAGLRRHAQAFSADEFRRRMTDLITRLQAERAAPTAG